MNPSPNHPKSNQREREIYKVTIIGSIVNMLLLVFKFMAGIVGHSAAMIADAVHSLSDFVTDIIVLFFVRISHRPKDTDHNYGHGKYETMATAIIALVLLVVGLGIAYQALQSILLAIQGEILPAPGNIALIAAIVSIVVKESLYQYTVYKAKNLDSAAVVANAWHHRSDALSSIGTAVGIGGAILLGDRWRVLDPIAALIVSVIIIRMAIKIFTPAIKELLESSLPTAVEDRIVAIATLDPEVTDPHNLRTRRLGNDYVIEMHIRMCGEKTLSETHSKATLIEQQLRDEFGARTHVAIHVEPVKK